MARCTTMPPLDPFPSASSPVVPDRAGGKGRLRLRCANALLDHAWAQGWAQRPSLDPAALVRKASLATGQPEGDDRCGWRERLALLCGDLDGEARLTPLGRTIAHGQIVAALANRFRAQALWRRYPDITHQPITAPIVVVGQMRSGTTRMQRLLACDPRLAFTRFFESWNPVPEQPRRPIVDDRSLKGWTGLQCARLLNPAFEAIHPTSCHAPDEEIGLQNLSIFGSAFEAQWRVPRYSAAVEQGESLETYRDFKRLLQTLAWLRDGRDDRPWILKVPQFTQDLPSLLRVFPDARLVFVHRDEDAVIASSASLVHNQMALQSDAADPRWIGQEWHRKVRLRHERMAAARTMAHVPQVDVAYDDVTRDWQGEMSRVYAMLGLTLPAAVLGRMARYVRSTAPHRRRRHVYDAGDFGLASPLARFSDDSQSAAPVLVPAALGTS